MAGHRPQLGVTSSLVAAPVSEDGEVVLVPFLVAVVSEKATYVREGSFQFTVGGDSPPR